MKNKKIASILVLLLTSLSVLRAQTILVDWTFDNIGITKPVPHPAPSSGVDVATALAAALGMTNTLTSPASVGAPDVIANPGADSDSTPSLPDAWRVRATGGPGGNGWDSVAPIGTQGAIFYASTVGYTNIQLTFDVSSTTQGEGLLQVTYTTDGINWTNAVITYSSNPSMVLNNSSPPTVTSGVTNGIVVGSYLNMVTGTPYTQDWFTNVTATFPSAANDNANFAVAIVNAAQGTSCLSASGTALNNTSGNWSMDNILITGTVGTSGGGGPSVPPTLTAATGVSVTDTSFTLVVGTGYSSWQPEITNITVTSANGTAILLDPTYTNGISFSSGEITFTNAATSIFQIAGTVNILIAANDYGIASVSQYLRPGPATQFVITTQPVAPTGDGGTLVTQPVLQFEDEYDNVATDVVDTVTASLDNAGGPGTWILGGGTSLSAVAGVVNFTNLSASSGQAYTGATITFTPADGFSPVPAASFNIPAPATAFTPGNLAVEQEDTVTKNSTFSILEINPTIVNQSAPVNIFAIPATGTNGLRQSSSASTGRLADSDDGSLLCFSAALCDDSTIADATAVYPRGGASLNSQGNYVLQAMYSGYGGATADQARSAITVDDTNFYMGDKGGVYINGNTTNNAYIPYSAGNGANVRSLKSYGGTVYVMQQSGGTDPYATVVQFLPLPNGTPNIPGSPSAGDQSLFAIEGFPTDPLVNDFYMLNSGSNTNIYDYCYYISATNATLGTLYKYYYTQQIDGAALEQIWAEAGTSGVANANGGDGLCARTNPITGGIDIFYTTGAAGTAGNSVVMVHDSASYSNAMVLSQPVTLYTAPAGVTLKGIAFAPVTTSGGSSSFVTLPLHITSGSAHVTNAGKATATASFAFTNTPSLTFTVLGSTKVTTPLSTWPVVGTVTDNPPGSGLYQFIDPNPATNSAEFYTLRHP